MTSSVDIGNLALDEIDARASVTSIFPSDGSLSANVLNRQYRLRVEEVSRAAHWNCLRFQAPLALLKAWPGTPENPNGTQLPSPPRPWIYEYAKPADSLKERFIIPLLPMPNENPPLTTAGGVITPPFMPGKVIDYVVATDTDAQGNRIPVILTNMSQAQMVYTADYSDFPDLWDPQFRSAVVSTIASYIAAPITGKDQKTAALAARARDSILRARVSDGNEGPSNSDVLPEWLRVRGRGSGFLNQVPFVAPWDSISFGDGSFLGP